MKFRHFHFALLGLALCTSFIVAAQNKAPQLGKDPIADIIKSMTLEEKAKLVTGKGLSIPGVSMQIVMILLMLRQK